MARKLWQIEVWHDGLNKYRCIRGYDKDVVERKAAAQQAAWDELWKRKSEQQQKALGRLQKTLEKQEMIEEARKRSEEALKAIKDIENTLKLSLEGNKIIDWELLKDKSEFPKQKPLEPKPIAVPEPPKETDAKYRSILGIFDRIFPSRKQKKINYAKLLFQKDYEEWKRVKEEAPEMNVELQRKYQKELEQWKAEYQEFIKKQNEINDTIDRWKDQYYQKNPDAIEDYCELVLSNSKYPDNFPQEYDLDYNPEIPLKTNC